MQRQFLSGDSEDQRKMAWVKWDTVYMPKDKGGLGINFLEAFNIALLSRWRWKCLTGSNSLLYKLLKCRYGELIVWQDSEVSQHRLQKTCYGGTTLILLELISQRTGCSFCRYKHGDRCGARCPCAWRFGSVMPQQRWRYWHGGYSLTNYQFETCYC